MGRKKGSKGRPKGQITRILLVKDDLAKNFEIYWDVSSKCYTVFNVKRNLTVCYHTEFISSLKYITRNTKNNEGLKEYLKEAKVIDTEYKKLMKIDYEEFSY